MHKTEAASRSEQQQQQQQAARRHHLEAHDASKRSTRGPVWRCLSTAITVIKRADSSSHARCSMCVVLLGLFLYYCCSCRWVVCCAHCIVTSTS